MKKLLSKIGKIILVVVTLITSCHAGYKGVKAVEQDTIYAKSTYGNMLKYEGQEITTTFVVYNKNGKEYPAYRTNPKGEGVKISGKYQLVAGKKIDDVEIWKVVINGYPYQTFRTLGCNNEQEAYTATEEAIFCQKYGRTPDDYEAIGEAGTRVKNAITKILNNTKYSEKIDDELIINSEQGKFVLDSVDRKYMSQTFTINVGCAITDLKLTLEGDYPEGTKITNLDNREITGYMGFSAFKIIYPIKNATNSGNFKLKGVATLYSYPVIYGRVYKIVSATRSAVMDSEIQNYILTDSVIGNSETYKTLNYEENETKITIIKLDKSSNKPLEGVKFSLLDINKKPVYTDLVTDNRGEIIINNILPGRYYLQEVSTLEGYVKYDKLIAVSVKINQSVTITVNNSKESNVEYNENDSNITVEKDEFNSNIFENEENLNLQESNTNININNKNENTNKQETNTDINVNNENTNTNKQETNTNINVNNENTNTNKQETNTNTNKNIAKLPKTGM